MTYFFLPEDFLKLTEKVHAVMDEMERVAQDMGESCQEGAETYHDNFAYEDGERRLRMLSQRLRDLVRVRNAARVVDPDAGLAELGIGSRVTLQDLQDGAVKKFKIGSYMNFDSGDAISYDSPLAKLLMEAEPGERLDGMIGGRRRRFQVLAID